MESPSMKKLLVCLLVISVLLSVAAVAQDNIGGTEKKEKAADKGQIHVMNVTMMKEKTAKGKRNGFRRWFLNPRRIVIQERKRRPASFSTASALFP
jgi:hypothetical protein